MQFVLSAGAILVVVLWGLWSPASLGAVFDRALAAITHNFGWLYLWTVLGLVVMAIALAVSRYGELKLGGEDDEPEFSVGAWFAMLFAAGMGIGAPQIDGGLHAVFGLPVGAASPVAIIVVTTLPFVGAAVTRVARGIK